MQGIVGLWCAIAVLAVAAAYGLISYYDQTTAYQQMEASLVQSSPKDLVRIGNKEVGKLILQLDKSEAELKNLKLNVLSEKESKIISLDAEINSERERTKTVERRYAEQVEINKIAKAELEKVREIAELSGVIGEQEQRDKDDLRKKIDDVSVQLEQAQREKKSLQVGEKALTESAQRRIQILQREKAQLLEAINKKTEAIRRRATGTQSEADGKILSLDIPTRFCVIDLGRINGVHRGMRFDVMRWRQNKLNKLATIEVTKVGSSTSEAAILNEPPVRKVCPVTGYVATDIEERYSPYATGEGDRAIPLVSIVQEDVSSMKESDPVVEGDLLVNPVFERDKKLKIAFAGDPVVYPLDVLKNQIQEAGAVLQEMIDIDTDFLVVGRIDQDKLLMEPEFGDKDPKLEIYRKALEIANQYGIPIIREVELYDYLRD